MTTDYQVSISQFEGPLDLLLHLITRAELNIEDIFLSEITAQYLSYMEQLDELDMDRVSEFLTVAAQLVWIKSRQLLPRPPQITEEEDPAVALVRQLREYQRIKEAGEKMVDLLAEAKKSHTRLPADFPLPPQAFELQGATVQGLVDAFLALLTRQDEQPASTPMQRVSPDAYTVRDRVALIKDRLSAGAPVRFDELFDLAAPRLEAVTTFLALLELLTRGEIRISQRGPFKPIHIRATESLEEDDVEYTYLDEM
ncbi:MAG: segregation/condensation protein A [Clostridiales bacterium]|nr:segregation/condensation protein A [Clostridiales bacterium]